MDSHRPAVRRLDTDDLVSHAQEVMKRARFPHLATAGSDGQPRVRPVSPVSTDGFTVWVASLRRYGKTEEIAANPRVELCYLDPDHDQVRITGLAEVERNPELLQRMWDDNPLLRRYLVSVDNPELIIYRISPARVRFMREWALEYLEVPLEEPLAPSG